MASDRDRVAHYRDENRKLRRQLGVANETIRTMRNEDLRGQVETTQRLLEKAWQERDENLVVAKERATSLFSIRKALGILPEDLRPTAEIAAEMAQHIVDQRADLCLARSDVLDLKERLGRYQDKAYNLEGERDEARAAAPTAEEIRILARLVMRQAAK